MVRLYSGEQYTELTENYLLIFLLKLKLVVLKDN